MLWTKFTLTASKKRTERDALEFTRRMQCGSPVINVYEIDKEAMEGLKVIKIAKPDMDWLKISFFLTPLIFSPKNYVLL